MGTAFLGRDGTPMGMGVGMGAGGIGGSGGGLGGLGGLTGASGFGGGDSASETHGGLDSTGHYNIKALQQKAQMAEIKR